MSISLLDMCADPWRAGGAACRSRSQSSVEMDHWRRDADPGRALFDVKKEWMGGWQQHMPIWRRTSPSTPRRADF